MHGIANCCYIPTFGFFLLCVWTHGFFTIDKTVENDAEKAKEMVPTTVDHFLKSVSYMSDSL